MNYSTEATFRRLSNLFQAFGKFFGRGSAAALNFFPRLLYAPAYINFVIALAGFLVFYIKILQLDRARCADSQNSQDSSLSSFHFFSA
jgi:hypothetical protein